MAAILDSIISRAFILKETASDTFMERITTTRNHLEKETKNKTTSTTKLLTTQNHFNRPYACTPS